MTYIISGSSLRGLGGFGGLGSLSTEIYKGEGKGTKDDPFGGIGGSGSKAESNLRALVQGGVTFKSAKNGVDQFQEGFLNNEKYIYVQGGDKFYKFKVPNMGGDGSPAGDKKASDWFDGVVAAAKASVPVTSGGGLTLPGSGLKLPVRGGTLIPGGEAGEASTAGKTMLLVGAAVAIAAVVLLKGRKGKG